MESLSMVSHTNALIKNRETIEKLFVIKILANRDAIFFVSSDQNMLLPDFVDTFNGFFVHLKRIS